MKAAVYDLTTAMKECEDVIAFARQHKNSMAYCKAVELRAKLSGLLIEKVEVVSVDLTDALARAEARLLNGVQGPAAHGPINWVPQIPGTPAVGNSEAGPADGQVGSSGEIC